MDSREIRNCNYAIIGWIILLGFFALATWKASQNPLYAGNENAPTELSDSFFYFFSAAAQTMGALIAIVLTAIYALVTAMKPADNPALEPTKRLMFRDPYLLGAVYFSLGMIITALFGILYVYTSKPFPWMFTIVAVIVGLAGIGGVGCLLWFLFMRGPKYINPNHLIQSDFNLEKAIKMTLVPVQKIIDYSEVCFLMELKKKGNYGTKNPLLILDACLRNSTYSVLLDAYSLLGDRLQEDLPTVQIEREEEYLEIYHRLTELVFIKYNPKIDVFFDRQKYWDNLKKDIFIKHQRSVFSLIKQIIPYSNLIIAVAFTMSLCDLLDITYIDDDNEKVELININSVEGIVLVGGWLDLINKCLSENLYLIRISGTNFISKLMESIKQNHFVNSHVMIINNLLEIVIHEIINIIACAMVGYKDQKGALNDIIKNGKLFIEGTIRLNNIESETLIKVIELILSKKNDPWFTAEYCISINIILKIILNLQQNDNIFSYKILDIYNYEDNNISHDIREIIRQINNFPQASGIDLSCNKTYGHCIFNKYNRKEEKP